MPLMYHENRTEPVSVSDGGVETMLNRGYSLEDVRKNKTEKPVEKVTKSPEKETDDEDETRI